MHQLRPRDVSPQIGRPLPRRATVLLLMLLGAVAGCGPAGAAEERGVEIRLRSLTLSQRAAQLVVAGADSPEEARRRVVMEGLGGVSAESRERGVALLHDSLFTGAQVPPLVARELSLGAEALDPGSAAMPGAAQIALGVLRAPTLNGGLPSPLLLLPEVRDGEAVGARVRAARAWGIIPAVEAFGAAAGVESGNAQRWDRARLEAIEIRGLRRALAGGAGVVLLAPTVLPALTGDTLPLPLSAAAISGVLRGELGWEGTVAAELPPLAAWGDTGDAGEAAVAAIGAGIDLLLDVADPDGVVDALVRAVAVGRLAEWRLDEAAGRVLHMKSAAVGRGAAAGTPTPAPPGGDVAVAAAASRAPVLRLARAEDVGMDEALLARVDATIRAAIAEGAFPGAALAVGRRGRMVRLRGYGNLDRAPGAAAVDPANSLYDVASLTKVVATTSAVMALVEDGRLALDAPAARYLGEFTGGGRDSVTVRQLLAHTAGLPAGLNLYGYAASPEDAMRRAASVRLVLNPGEAALYSDLGMILLAEVVGRAAGEPLDRFVAWRVFAPLGMSSTMFLPPLVLQPHTATSALDSERDFPLRGVVHDGNAFRLGGVAGHAGLFSTARDMAVFAQMMLAGGAYGDVRIFQPATVRAFTTRQPRAAERALGWDTPGPESSAGSYFSARSYGHTGYTGTSLWIDPERDLFVVLLTNRTYDRTALRRMLEIRREIHDGISLAVTDPPPVRRPGAIAPISPPAVQPPTPPSRRPAPRSPPARRP